MAFVPEESFDCAVRAAVLDAIRRHPGATISDLARAAGVTHTTATYHLRRAEKRGLVVSMRRGQRRHYFLNGQATPKERTLTVARRMGRSEAVLARIPKDAGATLGAISDGIGMSKPGVYWHLVRLEALGLVVAEGPAGARRYRAVG